jgi:hypothetical protein
MPTDQLQHNPRHQKILGKIQGDVITSQLTGKVFKNQPNEIKAKDKKGGGTQP